jgi:hypothetical protein
MCTGDQTQCYTGTVHVTLVHGTFAKHAAWIAPDSPLRKHLVEHVPGQIEFHNFTWSGWPSHLARVRAARRLHAEMSCRIRKYPTARHCIIAHSHGGNIACYAARDSELADKLHCIVTLSTPFLVCRRRHPSSFGIYALNGSLYFFIFAIICAIMFYSLGASTISDLFRAFRETDEHPFAPETLKSLLIFMLLSMPTLGLIVGLMFMINRFGPPWRRWLTATLRLPNLQNDRLFVVRGPADEANALLVTVQLLEIVITAFWGHNGAMDRLLRRLSARFNNALAIGRNGLLWRWFWGWSVVSLLFGVFALLPVNIFFRLTQRHAYFDLFYAPFTFFQSYTTRELVIWACVALTIALIEIPILLFLAAATLPLIVLLVCGATIGIIVGVAIIGLALVMLFVVPELGPFVTRLAVSAEPSPPGLFHVLQLTINQKIDTEQKLMHSITYSHPKALNAIAKVVAANNGTSGQHSESVMA